MEDKGLVDELALLSEADAIFMPNATETLTRFLKDKDNKPEDAIRALSTGFRGYAEMCNLLATWAEESGGCTAEEISGLMVKTVANKIKQVFFFLFVRFFFLLLLLFSSLQRFTILNALEGCFRRGAETFRG